MNDVTMTAIHSALRGLSARQRVISENVANVETPGYLAGRVEFEDALATALSTGDDPSQVGPSRATSLAPTGWNGNNVNLDDETIGLIDTNLRYQAALEAMNTKFRLLRTAIRGNA